MYTVYIHTYIYIDMYMYMYSHKKSQHTPEDLICLVGNSRRFPGSTKAQLSQASKGEVNGHCEADCWEKRGGNLEFVSRCFFFLLGVGVGNEAIEAYIYHKVSACFSHSFIYIYTYLYESIPEIQRIWVSCDRNEPNCLHKVGPYQS